VKRKVWILFLVVVAWSGWCCSADAQPGGPTMTVAVGFDGYCRDSGWCPVVAILSNEGPDVEGELRIAATGAPGSPAVSVYARQVLLPAHSRKAYSLLIPSDEFSPRSGLRVELVAQDRVLAWRQAAVTWLDQEDRLYGVASSSPSALNFLADVAPAGGRAAVAHLSLESLLRDPLGWEALDVLILSDVDTSALDGEQRRALETWLSHGGHLVVGGGPGITRTIVGVAGLLPVTVGGVRSVDALPAVGEWLDAPVAAGPYAVAETVLGDGEVLVEQGDGQGQLILLARRAYGAGTVDFLAFGADLNPFPRWDDNARFWEFIVGEGRTQVSRLAVQNVYNAREAVNAIPGLELPSMLQILAFMLVYTLLIGPVNYVVLRKLDRRELAWLTIPLLIVGFTACAYVTGFQIRGGTAIVHRLAAVYVPQGASVGRACELVGLFSPRRTTYDVRVTGAGVHPVSDDYYGGPAAQPLHIIQETGAATVTGLRVDVGGIRPFLVEGYVDVPDIETDLRLAGDASGALRLEGTVRNGDVPLEGVVLLAGDQEQQLGDMEAGESVPVHMVIGSGLPPFEDLPERILGPGSYWDDRSLYRRYQFLQALFSTRDPGVLEAGVYLVGWAEEKVPLPVEVVEHPFSTVETVLYVYTLSVAGVEPGATVVIPSGLITRETVDVTGFVDIQPGRIHIEPEAGVMFRFVVWSGVAVRQFDELELELRDYSVSGSYRTSPAVFLWNRKLGAWEGLDLGWGRHLIQNADTYVSPSGAILLRLEADAGLPVEMESLSISLKGQR
jgi:hypothetical protein